MVHSSIGRSPVLRKSCPQILSPLRFSNVETDQKTAQAGRDRTQPGQQQQQASARSGESISDNPSPTRFVANPSFEGSFFIGPPAKRAEQCGDAQSFFDLFLGLGDSQNGFQGWTPIAKDFHWFHSPEKTANARQPLPRPQATTSEKLQNTCKFLKNQGTACARWVNHFFRRLVQAISMGVATGS